MIKLLLIVLMVGLCGCSNPIINDCPGNIECGYQDYIDDLGIHSFRPDGHCGCEEIIQ